MIEGDNDQTSISSCVWRIKATPGKKILASFRCRWMGMGDFDRNPVLTLLTVLSEFDVTASTDCSSDYVTITTGDPAQVLESFMDPILGLKTDFESS